MSFARAAVMLGAHLVESSIILPRSKIDKLRLMHARISHLRRLTTRGVGPLLDLCGATAASRCSAAATATSGALDADCRHAGIVAASSTAQLPDDRARAIARCKCARHEHRIQINAAARRHHRPYSVHVREL
jgi:hypothetical protein